MSDAHLRAMVPTNDLHAQALGKLLDALAQRRDSIAEADLAAANLRIKLSAFEAQHRGLLRDEHHSLGLVMGLLRHTERWMLTLSVYTLRPQDQNRLMDRLDSQRRSERQRLDQLGWAGPATRAYLLGEDDAPNEAAPKAPRADSAEGKERLKKAFRSLARRFHPDLADGEAERATFGDRMARINTLYAQGNLTSLEAMVLQTASAPDFCSPLQGGRQERRPAPGRTSADNDLNHLQAGANLADQVAAAKERLGRFEAVLESLREEMGDLMASPTYALMDAMTPRGRRTAQVIVADLRTKTERERASRIADVPRAMAALEACVTAYNFENETDAELPPFDPYVDQELARLSLEHLASLRPSPKVQRLVLELENIAEHQPAVGRLILLTYVAQLSQRPLPGLESFEAIAERLEAAGKRDVPPMDLAEALIAAEGLVEYGPRRDGAAKVHMALIFRASGIEQAVPLMLRQFTMRQLFRQVLLHLGRAVRCGLCRRHVFTVPLFRLRGLDNLRALVCPHCGTTQSSYFLPKGRDIQTVLNAAYLELDLVHEYTCSLSRTSIGLQLLPVEAAAMTVMGLRNRLHQEVFARHNLPVLPRQIIMSQGGELLRDGALLTELMGRRITVNLAPGTPLGEAAALETLRFRIRNRFRSDPGRLSPS